MAKLIISNRVSELEPDGNGGLKAKAAGGGLAVLMQLAAKSGDVLLGWDGKTYSRNPPGTVTAVSNAGITHATFGYVHGPGEKFYNPEDKNAPEKGKLLDARNENGTPKAARDKTDFTNGTLWPLFHGMKFGAIRRTLLQAYATVNEQFATRAHKIIEARAQPAGQDAPITSIEVQDYHLMPLGERLRNKGVTMPIGFFLHIPFPKAEERAKLSDNVRKKLFGSLLAYDLVGFQTPNDLNDFKTEAVTMLGCTPGKGDSLRTPKGTTVHMGVYPAGIQPEEFSRLTYTQSEMLALDEQNKGRNEGVASLLKRVGTNKMLLSVERMDPSKGIKERLEEYRDMLREFPEAVGRVTMVQIGTITRQGVSDYKRYRRDVLRLEQEINAEFASPGRPPAVIVSEQTWDRHQLAHLAHNAGCGAATSLRDGMNLWAREFVAAQDSRNPARLIVSSGLGVSHEFGEKNSGNPRNPASRLTPHQQALRDAGAIVVDPKVKGSIKKALRQVIGELFLDPRSVAGERVRELRMAANANMSASNHLNTAQEWGERFSSDLAKVTGSDVVVPFKPRPIASSGGPIR